MPSVKRAQSAMEYLMTYGWAILVIAVALGALYQLGVFNPGSFQSKAQPGSCQVVRPNGPNTTQLIATQGVCSGQRPQFVAVFSGASTSSIGSIPDAGFPFGNNAVSIFAWVQSTQSANYPYVVQYGNVGSSAQNWVLGDYNGIATVDNVGGYVTSATSISNGKWHNIGFTYASAGNVIVYVDGVATYSGAPGLTPSVNVLAGTSMRIGYGSGSYYSGLISNVQVYNSSLSANEAKAIYNGGIGSAPIRLQSLVGWWQLNSNPNDYSGDLLNGVANSVSYSTTYSYP